MSSLQTPIPPAPIAQETWALPPEAASSILKADMRNLLGKVRAGKPLTRHERQLVAEQANGVAEPSHVAFAANQSQLAALLGVSRQVINHHCKRPGNPGRQMDGRYDVRRWRAFLALNGRVLSGSTASGTADLHHFGDGVGALLGIFGEELPHALSIATRIARLQPTQHQQDNIATLLWLLMATAADRILLAHGFESVYAPDEDTGGVFYPEAIVAAAQRIGAAPTVVPQVAPSPTTKTARPKRKASRKASKLPTTPADA